jgi:O-phosphoseryl-tRNA(Cys) synthetase
MPYIPISEVKVEILDEFFPRRHDKRKTEIDRILVIYRTGDLIHDDHSVKCAENLRNFGCSVVHVDEIEIMENSVRSDTP